MATAHFDHAFAKPPMSIHSVFKAIRLIFHDKRGISADYIYPQERINDW